MQPLAFYNDLHTDYAALPKLTGLDIIVKVPELGRRLKQAGFQKESDECFKIALGVLKKFADTGNVQGALIVENMVYDAFVKTTEAEDHYYNCFKQWSGLLQTLGRKHRRALRPRAGTRKICFVLQAAVLLGHTEVMFTIIDAWRALGIEADIYVAAVGAIDPRFQTYLDKRNITFIPPSGPNGEELPLADSVHMLRDRLEKLDVNTVVWASSPTLASYALAMKLAPRQVFWSVKFHPVYMQDVDVHLCGGHEVETARTYHGRPWTVSPFPLTIAFKENDPADVRKIRESFPPDAILLGSLAREEKFNSPAFLMTVCGLLARNPQAYFLWTGRSQPENVVATFKNFGVADRCRFIGWVDTNAYAEALDVFLETFPFGCGITGFQAMVHETPLLSLQGMDMLYGYQLHGAVAQQFKDMAIPRTHFETLEILTAADPGHYIELAQKLIDSESYRKEIGAREKAYAQKEQAAVQRYAQRMWTNMTGLSA